MRLAARARYWRRRALRAEAQAKQQALELSAEMARNREREDTFVSATVMGTRGMYGVAPRTGPALKPVKQLPAPTTMDDGLTYADRLEFDLYWKPDAEAAGVDLATAKRKYMEEVVLPRRMPLNDDPYNN